MKTFKKIIFLLLLLATIPYFAFWIYFQFAANVLIFIIPTFLLSVIVACFMLSKEIVALKKLSDFSKEFEDDEQCSAKLSKLKMDGFPEILQALGLLVDRFESKQRELRQIIDLVPGFIYSKDINGKILLVNEALAGFLKISSADMIGKHENEFQILQCLSNKEIENKILSSSKSGSVNAEECEIGTTDKKRRTSDFIEETEYLQNDESISAYLVFRAPLFDKGNNKIGILVFAYDITMLKNVQQNLKTLNLSLEARVKEEVEKNSIKDKELMKAKEKFVRNAVHELNSALTVITLNAEYLMEEYGKNRSTSAILGAAKKLSNSYDDLSYSTVKDSPYYQEEKEIDLSSLLFDRIHFFEDIAELSDIVIKSEVVSNITVTMNVVKLTRIIDNNLSNAIKYSYPKNIVVARCFCDSGAVVLEFESIGKKIEDRNKIFDLYSREDGIKRGHGVGLSMVKEICDESHIDIEVICDENKNTFRYRFSYAC